MKRGHARILLAVASLSASAAAGAAEPTDFNDARLQSGRLLYDDQRFLEAIDQFRVAAFGYLDRPSKLSECLARLVLAQIGAARSADADATILRFVELERRFPSYPPGGLEPERQAEFRTALLRRVSEATLLGIPSLAALVETEEQKITKLPPAERRRALEAAARRDPRSAVWPLALGRDAMDRSDWKDAERWAGKALAIQPFNPEALALRAKARVRRGELADARADLAALPPTTLEKDPDLYADLFVVLVDAGDWAAAESISKRVPPSQGARSEVARAQQRLSERQRVAAPAKTAGSAAVPASARSAPAPGPTPDAAGIAARSRDALAEGRREVAAGKAGDARRVLADALRDDPANRELRLVLLEAATLTRAYGEAAAQLSLVSPFGDNEAPSMFYAAVVLYETGKTDEARMYMARAMPRVSGPLVDEYSKKILGP